MTPLARSIAVLLLCPLLAAAQDWPQFRGPEGQGLSKVTAAPLKWSESSDNIKWRLPIEGLGWSSPVVLDKHLWLTTATEGGKSLRAVCVDAAAGKLLHNIEVFHAETPGPAHKKNSYASPTPVLDKDRVYVHFGPNGTACLSGEGKILWKQVLKYNPVHGAASSPALVGELLIISCDGADSPFLIALDRKTGAQRWKSPREPNTDQKKFAFCTPLPIEVGKTLQVVSPFAGGVTSYDPASGRSIWHVRYPNGYSVVPRPVYGHGMVFLSTGFDKPTVIAIKVDGKGDVTETHVAWRMEKGAPLNPSPLLIGEELYLVSDQGIATCADAKTGKVHWQERLGGNFSASPLHVAGNIYFLSEDGVTTVVKADKTFTQVAKNELKGRTFASPAPIEGALFLRTETQLLRIEAEAK
jgi:outer membrane protein assembly factor BamB